MLNGTRTMSLPGEYVPTLGAHLSLQITGTLLGNETFVRTNGTEVYLAPIDGMNEWDVEDTHFRKVAGLSDSNCVSFESLKFPGRFLRHQNDRLTLAGSGFLPSRSMPMLPSARMRLQGLRRTMHTSRSIRGATTSRSLAPSWFFPNLASRISTSGPPHVLVFRSGQESGRPYRVSIGSGRFRAHARAYLPYGGRPRPRALFWSFSK